MDGQINTNISAGISINDMINEVDDLISFVSFGKQRLDDLNSELECLEKEIKSVNDRSQCDVFATTVGKLNSSVQTTGSSLSDWKKVANTCLQMLRESHELPQDNSGDIDYIGTETKISQLLSMINGQSNRVKHLCDKLSSVGDSVRVKKSELRPQFQRAREPELVGQLELA